MFDTYLLQCAIYYIYMCRVTLLQMLLPDVVTNNICYKWRLDQQLSDSIQTFETVSYHYFCNSLVLRLPGFLLVMATEAPLDLFDKAPEDWERYILLFW